MKLTMDGDRQRIWITAACALTAVCLAFLGLKLRRFRAQLKLLGNRRNGENDGEVRPVSIKMYRSVYGATEVAKTTANNTGGLARSHSYKDDVAQIRQKLMVTERPVDVEWPSKFQQTEPKIYHSENNLSNLRYEQEKSKDDNKKKEKKGKDKKTEEGTKLKSALKNPLSSKSKPKPKFKTKSEPKSEPKPEPRPEAKPAPRPEPKPEPKVDISNMYSRQATSLFFSSDTNDEGEADA